jgi:hypothetical protein
MFFVVCRVMCTAGSCRRLCLGVDFFCSCLLRVGLVSRGLFAVVAPPVKTVCRCVTAQYGLSNNKLSKRLD